MPDSEYSRELKLSVENLVAKGVTEYFEILRALGGADPRLVEEVLHEVQAAEVAEHLEPRDPATARRYTAALPLRLPAPNPLASQWWFTLDSVVRLADRVWWFSKQGKAAFLGCPTVGYYYSYCYAGGATILDLDSDVIAALSDVSDYAHVIQYDVANSLPPAVQGDHAVVLIDPPWYPDATRAFIARARQLLASDGVILCMLPSRLTRAGIIEERTALLSQLLSSGFEIAAIESAWVEYCVPPFEARAYTSVEPFSAQAWRRGDLLVLRVGSAAGFACPDSFRADMTETFARSPTSQRFFLLPERCSAGLKEFAVRVHEFETSVSSRAVRLDSIGAWGTNKRAVKCNNAIAARRILAAWQSGLTRSQARTTLEADGVSENDLLAFAEALELWGESDGPSRRRTSEELEKQRKDSLSEFASQPSAREYEFENDGFRLSFQRDRDRVLWSHALKRLANKTQLFPARMDEHLRRRLSHVIEVMQLASTISAAFGLDRDLTEASALAHDLGHTPFGHAGEHALNAVLDEVDGRLGGFNHYEHGVDVVRWLEDVYRSPGAGGFPGLNLTPETVEAIFKHTFHRGARFLGQQWLASRTKHPQLRVDVSCHLEGQAVRIADKISYFISDLEDGIRQGIITVSMLLQCRFFHRAPIDLDANPEDELVELFISQRRAMLRVLMEDVLTATDRRLVALGSPEEVRHRQEYIVAHSNDVSDEMAEVWRKIQAGVLHKDPAVVTANNRAAAIVSDLFLAFAVAPHLIDERFRRSHERLDASGYMDWYRDRVGASLGIPKRRVSKLSMEFAIGGALTSQGDNWAIPTEWIVRSKDYVASLTDSRAMAEHRRHCGALWDSDV